MRPCWPNYFRLGGTRIVACPAGWSVAARRVIGQIRQLYVDSSALASWHRIQSLRGNCADTTVTLGNPNLSGGISARILPAGVVCWRCAGRVGAAFSRSSTSLIYLGTSTRPSYFHLQPRRLALGPPGGLGAGPVAGLALIGTLGPCLQRLFSVLLVLSELRALAVRRHRPGGRRCRCG